MAQELTQENLPPFDLDYYMSDSYKQKENESMYIEASAGTGKTFTITGIVKTLVEKRGINLDEILVVTYTEKAVGELRDRRLMLTTLRFLQSIHSVRIPFLIFLLPQIKR